MSINNNEATILHNQIVTSEAAYRRKRKKEKEEQLTSLLALAGMGGAVYGLAVIANDNPEVAKFFAKLPGANRYAKKHERALARQTANAVPNSIDLTSQYANQSFGRSMLSIMLTLEELSPFGIAKTLQTTNILEPIFGYSRKQEDIKITGSALLANQDYYYNMIREASGRKDYLLPDDIKHGFTIRNGALYRNNADGTVDTSKKVLNSARVVTAYVGMGETDSPNRILSKFANVYNSSLGWNAFQHEQMVMIGGRSDIDLASKWMQATVRQSLEIGFKTFDNPLSGVEELFRAAGAENVGLFENETYKKIKSKLNVQLGTEGDYHSGISKSLYKTAKNLTIASLGLYSAYHGVNELLDFVSPDNSIWSEGLAAGVTHNYVQVRANAAKILADPFQGYKEKQEYAAEGSTSLLTLAGFPIAGATLGASIPYFKRMGQSAVHGVEEALDIAHSASHGYGFLTPITSRLGWDKTTLTKSLALRGAAIGAIVAAPFLPGALIGKSSEQIEEEYNGDRLVANRKGANWFTGSQHITGGKIESFTPSRAARILSDGKDEVRYNGDESLKRSLNPILNPLGYLKNPYRYEEMHQHDQPYPVWGMEVPYGGMFGKLFQGTIGEIIKPTRVNPELGKQLQAGLEYYRDGGGQGTYSSTQSEDEIGLSLPFGGNGIINSLGQRREGGYPIAYTAKPEERELVQSGMMLPQNTPHVNEHLLSLSQTYGSATDFVGIKGFTGDLLVQQMGFNPSEIRTQLARSGNSTNMSKDFLDENLGDFLGLGEFQRRIMPTSASSNIDDVNPMRNTVAPNWLPQNKERYYKDFGEGDFYDKVTHGEYRLPGKGYEAWNQELKGKDPNDYPLVHQYRILSDVAPGSEEQISLRKRLFELENSGKLSKNEKELFFTTLAQEQAKASSQRRFSEYKTEEERSRMGLGWKMMNKLWETASHNAESPLEPLTPFRPGAKFIHNRSAIEDYQMNMLSNADNSIWTNPYSHFIKPTANRLEDVITPGTHISDESRDRDRFDAYFDKMEYLKARKEGRANNAQRTTHGAVYSGILNKDDYNKFKTSLHPEQQAYVDTFSRETSRAKREQILSMVHEDARRGYKEIWKNLDIANTAIGRGKDAEEAVKEHFVSETRRHFGSVKGRTLDEQVANAREVRLQEADKEAEGIVRRVTGKPSEGWLGWDPRLSMDEVKIRTLTVGKQDYFRHGYWNSDVARNERIIALDRESEITDSYNQIVNNMRDELYRKSKLEAALNKYGMSAKRITFNQAGNNEFDMKVEHVN